MKRYLFLMYHGKGHFNAIFELASIIRRNGDEAVISGFEFFRSYVSSQGFEFHGLKTVPFGLEFEPWTHEIQKKKNIWWRALRDRWKNKLFHDRRNELTGLIAEVRPDIVLIDSWQSTDVIVLYSQLVARGIRVAMVQTMCSTVIVNNVPPLNSAASPDNAVATRSALEKYRSDALRTNIRQLFRYAGRSNFQLIQRMLRENGMIEKGYRITPAVFAPSIDGIKEFILCDPAFDFGSKSAKQDQKYIGFLPWLNRHDLPDEKFEEIFSKIRSVKTESEKPLVYFSLGTVLSLTPIVIDAIINTISTAISKLDWLCIISTPNTTVRRPSDSRIFHFTHVPQVRILRDTDIFITTGGLNSIKEAISLEVPMIVSPLTIDTDTQGNAARVNACGIGVHIDLRNLSPSGLADLLQKVNASPSFKMNLRSMNSKKGLTEPELKSILENISVLK